MHYYYLYSRIVDRVGTIRARTKYHLTFPIPRKYSVYSTVYIIYNKSIGIHNSFHMYATQTILKHTNVYGTRT